MTTRTDSILPAQPWLRVISFCDEVGYCCRLFFLQTGNVETMELNVEQTALPLPTISFFSVGTEQRSDPHLPRITRRPASSREKSRFVKFIIIFITISIINIIVVTISQRVVVTPCSRPSVVVHHSQAAASVSASPSSDSQSRL